MPAGKSGSPQTVVVSIDEQLKPLKTVFRKLKRVSRAIADGIQLDNLAI